MLADMSKWIIQQVKHTVIIGRNEQRLRQLKSSLGNVHTKQLDYKHTEDLKQMIRTTIETYGSIDLVVAWVHSDAPNVIPTILNEICTSQRKKWRLFHVKGSSQHLEEIQQSNLDLPDRCLYRDVHLGFKREGDMSRWLKDEEISAGVMKAIQHDRKHTVIGTLEPWEERPKR